MKSKKTVFFLVFILGFAGVFAWKQWGDLGQQTISRPEVEDDRSQQQVQQDFEEFTNQIFKEEVANDSISMNFTLDNPQEYGVAEVEPTLGDYSLEDFQADILQEENWLASLESFPYDKLDEEQQLTYDILRQLLKTDLKFSDFLEYDQCLGPVTGIQAQLPVLLAEYSFDTGEEVETYLALLEQVPEYFGQIASYEKEKSQKGTFMSDTTADAIIKQCQEFIANPEENYLISIFDTKVAQVDGISTDEMAEYKERNKKAVLENVIPAYEDLTDTLESLKGTGNNEGGLCKLENGKEYYAYLVELMTGSSRSVDEINELLDKTLRQEQKTMSKIMTKTPDAYYDAQDVDYPGKDPADTMNWLQKQIAGDFSALPEGITGEVKYVDESLEDSLSPAFYLASPIDAYEENVIYINQNEEYDLTQAYSTIAHESYPGHLYQHCYFQATEPSPLRSILETGGYMEGWGTYAELYSFEIAGLENEVCQLLKSNTLATLCLYAKADIGVNYAGWNQKKLAAYLEDYGFDEIQAKSIYDSMIAEPVSYMKYTLGYLEIMELREEAENKLGNDFSLKEFHDFFLSTGPAPFLVLQDQMDGWIAEKQG